MSWIALFAPRWQCDTDLFTKIKGPEVKQQKMSPRQKEEHLAKADPALAAEKPVVAAVKSPDEIKNPARKSAATALIRLFVERVNEALKQKSFTLPDGQIVEDVARQLGLTIEQAMYQNICAGAGEPTEPYKVQLRTILFNVKKNHSLRDRLLVGSLPPDALSKMSAQDMASEELQQRDAEIKREAEKQHVIVRDQGPRIRRTHKGEELVEDDSHVVTDSVFSAAPAVRGAADVEGSPSRQSLPSPTVPQQRPDLSKSLAVDPNVGASDGNHFQSRARSPDMSNQDNMFPEISTNVREPIPRGKVQADADVDHLLRDEDEPESPPYSPKEFDDDDKEAVWRGRVVMKPVAEFSSSAKHVGGADLSARIPWSELMPPTLLVHGRIDIQLASDYLCGLRFSSSTDVSVLSIKRPASVPDQAGFDTLFKYFSDRKRYGVVGKHPVPSVKDTYIVPVEAGSAKKPEFIELLQNNALQDPLPEPILLVAFVVKTGDSAHPSLYRPIEDPSGLASTSPVTIPAGTPHPLTPGTFVGSHLNPTFGVPQPPQQVRQSPQQTLALALQIMGPQAHLPVVQQVIQQAPNMDATQLGIVRDILQQQPNAASSYETLVSTLYSATSNH